jgi:hypothetical protein
MINIKDRNRKCNHPNCNTTPIYNYPNIKPAIFCSKHFLPNMINVIDIKCKSEFCDATIGTRQKYKGYCARCYIHLFPDESIVTNYKTKEREVIQFIKTSFPNYNFIYDKIIANGISKRRPDILLNLDDKAIIIEIDENSHKKYDCICENKRLMEISRDLNFKPIIFIRFNPDKYLDKNNNNIPSCFSICKETGLVKINIKKNWNERLKNLKNQLDYWVNNNTNKTIEIIELYYDGF